MYKISNCAMSVLDLSFGIYLFKVNMRLHQNIV